MSAMTETVTATSLVTLHYRIATADNVEMVSTFDATPATLQLGNGELAPTLEACLEGLEVGELKTFVLAPEMAFGLHNAQMVNRVPRDALPLKVEPKLFEPLSLPAEDGTSYSALVLEMDDEFVLLDFNHPLAGKQILFEVKVVGVL
jgi:FKBP-type peptidyl-prolyl cis-trans isomerase SlpA